MRAAGARAPPVLQASGELVGKQGASQARDVVLELQSLLFQPPQLELIHVQRFLQPPDGRVEIAVFLLQLGDSSCQINSVALGGFGSTFLIL